VQRDVVADIDHGGDLGIDGPGHRADAEQEPGAADAPGQYDDVHDWQSFRNLVSAQARGRGMPRLADGH